MSTHNSERESRRDHRNIFIFQDSTFEAASGPAVDHDRLITCAALRVARAANVFAHLGAIAVAYDAERTLHVIERVEQDERATIDVV